MEQQQDELRVVVLGRVQSGKTSLINTVLSQCMAEPEPIKEGSTRSPHCLKRQGDIRGGRGRGRGRKITLVDTHGWWECYLLEDTAEIVKQELLLSVRLCGPAPGPNVVLLAVALDVPFTEQHREAIRQHMGLFGEHIWAHIIVVFTKGDCLEGKSIEEHIWEQGEAIRWILEKCGDRFHVVDNQSLDSDQVLQLLSKVEALTSANRGSCFQIDEEILKAVDEKRATVKVKAKARKDAVTQQRKLLEGEVRPLTSVRMVLLGWVSSGKTSVRNTILDENELASRMRTLCSDMKQSNVAGPGRQVSVIDTPGWWKYFPATYTPKWVKRELKRSLTLDVRCPHAFLLVLPLDVSFLKEQREVIEDNMKVFGDLVWKYTIVLFTWGDMLGDVSIEEHIESEGEPLRWLVEKCGNRYHVFDNMNRGDGSQVTELLQMIEEMVASNSVFCANAVEQKSTHREAEETPVKSVNVEVVELLDQEWQSLNKQLEKEIKKIWTEMDCKIKGNDSIDHDANFKDESDHTADSDDEGKPVGQAMADVQQSSELRDQLLREWGRREAILLERVRGILAELQTSYDVSSGVSKKELMLSYEKVWRWIKESDHSTASLTSEVKKRKMQ
ncbi:GTPase IMAP family member 8-like [Engraulis encrasicolus]|uniref:GTPase IMAP family member 8-like n=1 Tax=Engraulis encrasicolus TaxID=184585 RepID=UPI002FD24F8A